MDVDNMITDRGRKPLRSSFTPINRPQSNGKSPVQDESEATPTIPPINSSRSSSGSEWSVAENPGLPRYGPSQMNYATSMDPLGSDDEDEKQSTNIRLSGTDDSQLEKQETLSRKIESTLSKAQTRGSLYTKEDCACLWAFAGFRLYYPDERNLLVEQSGNSRRWGSQQVCRYVSNMKFHTIMRGIGYEQSLEDWDPDVITAEDLDFKGHGGFTAVYLSKGVELDLGRNATWEEIMAESTHLDGRGIVIRQGTLMLGMYISGKSKKLSAFKAYMTEDRTCLRKMASVGDLKDFPTALFRDSSPNYANGYIFKVRAGDKTSIPGGRRVENHWQVVESYGNPSPPSPKEKVNTYRK
ncbi:hypothetical protein E8E14_000991 [Neopestalotiopsis sp. 37M]|nr:hypothetical protein E8E14_000991 [Neopestalotiopsis sp. 37M]